MKVRNISKKIIGIYGKILMPGDVATLTNEQCKMPAVQSMAEAGRIALEEEAVVEPVQPQAASKAENVEDNATEDKKADAEATAASGVKPKGRAKKGAEN